MSDLPSGLTPPELADYVRLQIDQAIAYARGRRTRFRGKSVALRVITLVLSTASTVILGLQNLDPWTGTAFSLIAVVTLLSALEPFFAWRQLWVSMEEAIYRFHRLNDELGYYVAAHPPDALDVRRVHAIFEEYQQTWDRLSSRWLSLRENDP